MPKSDTNMTDEVKICRDCLDLELFKNNGARFCPDERKCSVCDCEASWILLRPGESTPRLTATMRSNGDAQGEGGLVAHTLRAGGHDASEDGTGRGAPLVSENQIGVRRLLPVECERLQGLPDDFTRYGIDEKGREIEMSDSARYFVCGNAVTSNVANWIGLGIPKTPPNCNSQNPPESR